MELIMPELALLQNFEGSLNSQLAILMHN